MRLMDEKEAFCAGDVFNRDTCLYFCDDSTSVLTAAAANCVSCDDSISVTKGLQGTLSIAYTPYTIGSVTDISRDIDHIKDALKILADRVGVSADSLFNGAVVLKNQFKNAGLRKLKKSELKTL